MPTFAVKAGAPTTRRQSAGGGTIPHFPCAVLPGTATARSPTHRTSAGKKRYDFLEKVWTKTSQWLQIPLPGDTGSCCPYSLSR